MSVKRAMREIDSPEFAEWMAYATLEPFGPEQEDTRAGMIAALIANVNRDPAKRAEPYTVEDFFPRYGEEEPEQQAEPADLTSKLTAWAAVMTAAAEKGPAKSELRKKG